MRCRADARPLFAITREQDAIESGLIKKVQYRKSKSSVMPADGDLVRLL